MIKVLILDDSVDYRRALYGALKNEFILQTVHNSKAAMRLLDETIQVVLIDVCLSIEEEDNRDGLTFLKWAKTRFPNIPMLMMSAYSDHSISVEANNSGAKHFLKKPIDLHQLKALLRQVGGRKRSESVCSVPSGRQKALKNNL